MYRNDIVARAMNAYFRACTYPAIYQQPAEHASCVQEHDGRKLAVLRSGADILAVYRLMTDGRLRRVHQWPEGLVLLCHKRSRALNVAQCGQYPKARASVTLNSRRNVLIESGT